MSNSNSKDGTNVPTSTTADATTSRQTIAKPNVSGSASDFERDLYKLINLYVNAGLSKVNLVLKMEYVTQSCRVS